VQEYPHHYVASASAAVDSNVQIESPGLDDLESAGPAEFGGPGNLWSPETLLVASVADCFILGFRAIARASKLDWVSLSCEVVGDLERVDRVTKFTSFRVRATLEVPEGTRQEKAQRLLEKAEKTCLITNSMTADLYLEAEVLTKVIAA
jgi:organic hydroperoxide reductase OsmC/OhrA